MHKDHLGKISLFIQWRYRIAIESWKLIQNGHVYIISNQTRRENNSEKSLVDKFTRTMYVDTRCEKQSPSQTDETFWNGNWTGLAL